MVIPDGQRGYLTTKLSNKGELEESQDTRRKVRYPMCTTRSRHGNKIVPLRLEKSDGAGEARVVVPVGLDLGEDAQVFPLVNLPCATVVGCSRR